MMRRNAKDESDGSGAGNIGDKIVRGEQKEKKGADQLAIGKGWEVKEKGMEPKKCPIAS